jgi:hypothetical protein
MTWECLECGAANPASNPACGSFACQQMRLDAIANAAPLHERGSSDLGTKIYPTPKKQHVEHPDFASFWEVYPRRKDRIVACRAFTQAVRKGIAPQAMIAGALRYAKEVEDKEPQYRLLPSTFINGRRWEDEPDASASVKPSDPRWDMPAVGTPEHAAWQAEEDRRAMEG